MSATAGLQALKERKTNYKEITKYNKLFTARPAMLYAIESVASSEGNMCPFRESDQEMCVWPVGSNPIPLYYKTVLYHAQKFLVHTLQ